MRIENRLQSKNLSKVQKIFANREEWSVIGHDTAHCVALSCARSTWSHYAKGLNCTKCLLNCSDFGAYFTKPKDPLTKEQRTDAFFSIPCYDCDNEYIGQIKLQFGTRLKEHQKAVFFCKKGKFSFIGVRMPNRQNNCVR